VAAGTSAAGGQPPGRAGAAAGGRSPERIAPLPDLRLRYDAVAHPQERQDVCCNAVNRGWQECPSRSVAAAEIERYVVEQLRGMARSACQGGSANGAIDLDRLWQTGSLTMQALAVRCLVERAEYDGDAGREQSCRKRKPR
jgi:hypothetical protein